ncbi:hypothetical protein A2U01_0054679, partial [Trifolium medium]|nr:hypothetical protein [Trifolium medium]
KEIFLSRNVTHHDNILPYTPSTNQFTCHYHTSCDPDPVHDASITIPHQITASPSPTLVHNIPNEPPDTNTTMSDPAPIPIEHENSSEPPATDTILPAFDPITISQDTSPQPTHRPTRDKHAPSYLSDCV